MEINLGYLMATSSPMPLFLHHKTIGHLFTKHVIMPIGDHVLATEIKKNCMGC